jgi:catechol 2,3-dioxygenase-like lactoylglutathione lyase family enzyme
MARPTRRQLVKGLAGIAAARTLRGDEPTLTVSGVDHIKLRVASAGDSAVFYFGLFGADILFLRNSTFPGSPLVDEFFMKLGAASFPYLMLSQVSGSEVPGLDHLSLILQNPASFRPTLERKGISPIHPDKGLWVRDADGTLIEFMPRPTWDSIGQNIRLPLPVNIRGVQPAFPASVLRRVRLRTPDVARSAGFYNQLFRPQSAGTFTYGGTVLELRPATASQKPGLDRLVIAVPNLKPGDARRILQRRGIRPYGSRHELLFRDFDGNELELTAL